MTGDTRSFSHFPTLHVSDRMSYQPTICSYSLSAQDNCDRRSNSPRLCPPVGPSRSTSNQCKWSPGEGKWLRDGHGANVGQWVAGGETGRTVVRGRDTTGIESWREILRTSECWIIYPVRCYTLNSVSCQTTERKRQRAGDASSQQRMACKWYEQEWKIGSYNPGLYTQK